MQLAVMGLVVSALAFSECEEDLAEEGRERLELNGKWQFRLDPDNVGLAQRWFMADVDYPDQIQVPGCWQAQGFGQPRGHLRHDYQGKAWYRRAVDVPKDWSGKRIWIYIGAASNTADVYCNGQKVGGVEGFLTPHEFDVTDAVRPGSENVITCCVDSRGVAPRGMFNMIGRWGGLNREVFLEARSDPMINDLFVIPDIKNRAARTQVVLRRHTAAEAWQGELTVRVAPVAGGETHEARSTVRFAAGQRESEKVVIGVKLDSIRTWSPEDPFLYRVEVRLHDEGELVDLIRDRFGMRELSVGEGGVLLLNGQPYFIRGLGDDSVEVITGIQYPDKQIYVDRLRMIKRYGFNAIRFLSHTPIKEYFEAADEVGVLLLCDGEYYGGPKQSIPILKKQVSRLIKTHCNHPSWYAFSSGNEFFQCQGASPDPDWIEYIQYAHETFKRLDPTRFFIGSEGANVFPTDIITQRGTFHGPMPPPDQPFDGLVDEVAYFKRALTDEEILKTANRSEVNYPQTIKSLGPAAYWRFEEKALGAAIDSSGHGCDGTFHATMKPDDVQRPGVLQHAPSNRAIHTSAARKGVNLKDVAADVFATGNEPFSVSLWVWPDSFDRQDYGTPFSFGAADHGRALLIAEDGNEGTGKLRLGRFYDDFLVSQDALVAGQWNHIGIAHDGARLKLHINGKFDSSKEIEFAITPVDGRIGASVSRARLTDSGEGDVREKYLSRPHIWHEFPNTYVGPLPDLAIADKWTGVFRDDNAISYHRRQIVGLGLLERYPEIRGRSIDLFHLYLKDNYERARHSPTMDGYNYWCFTDFPPGPEGDMTTYGMFSTVYEPEKFPDPAPILQFNRETVLLIDSTVDRRVLAVDQENEVTLRISHYGQRPIRDGRLVWEVTSDGESLQRGTIQPVQMEVGQVKPIGTLTLGPYSFERARRVRLAVRLESEACRQTNQWDFWAFTASRPNLQVHGVENLTSLAELDDRYGLGATDSKDAGRVILASRLSTELTQRIVAGETVVLLANGDTLVRPQQLTFWPQWIRSTGTFIEDHPALNDFPHESFCAYQFIRQFGNGLKTLNITEKRSIEREKFAPIVWALTQDYDPDLGGQWHVPKNRWKIFRHGVICEGRVGNGKLLVCCLDVLGGIRRKHPESAYLLDCLIEYASSPLCAPTSPPMTSEDLAQVFVMEAE